MTIFNTSLDALGRLKIPMEFIRAAEAEGEVFSFIYDEKEDAIRLIGRSAEEITSDLEGWSAEDTPVYNDIMAVVTLPRAARARMGWNENTALAVCHIDESLIVRVSDAPTNETTQRNSLRTYISATPRRERFIEVYCREAREAWDGSTQARRDDSGRLERVIVGTLAAATKDDRTSIEVEGVGGVSYTVRIANPRETVTCLVKLSDSYEEQAGKVYDTLIYTSVIAQGM